MSDDKNMIFRGKFVDEMSAALESVKDKVSKVFGKEVPDALDKSKHKFEELDDTAKKGNGFDSFSSKLNDIGDKVPYVGDKVQGLGKAVGFLANPYMLVGGAIAGAAVAMSTFAFEAADIVEHLDNVSLTTGMTTQQLWGLREISEQSGLSFDGLATAASELSKRVGNGDKSLKALGLTGADTMEDIAKVADKFAEAGTQAERNQIASDAFGRSWKELAPLLREGGDAIRALSRDVTLHEEDLDKYRRLDESVDAIGASWRGIKFEMGSVTAGPLATFMEGLQKSLGVMRELGKESSNAIEYKQFRSDYFSGGKGSNLSRKEADAEATAAFEANKAKIAERERNDELMLRAEQTAGNKIAEAKLRAKQAAEDAETERLKQAKQVAEMNAQLRADAWKELEIGDKQGYARELAELDNHHRTMLAKKGVSNETRILLDQAYSAKKISLAQAENMRLLAVERDADDAFEKRALERQKLQNAVGVESAEAQRSTLGVGPMAPKEKTSEGDAKYLSALRERAAKEIEIERQVHEAKAKMIRADAATDIKAGKDEETVTKQMNAKLLKLDADANTAIIKSNRSVTEEMRKQLDERKSDWKSYADQVQGMSSSLLQSGLKGELTLTDARKAATDMGIKMFSDFVTKKIEQMIMDKIFSSATLAATTAEQVAAMTAISSAAAPAAAGTALASFGANAGPAIAGLTSTYATAGALSVMRATGGPTSTYGGTVVGDGAPELYQPLVPGRIVSHSQTINHNTGGNVTVYLTGRPSAGDMAHLETMLTRATQNQRINRRQTSSNRG